MRITLPSAFLHNFLLTELKPSKGYVFQGQGQKLLHKALHCDLLILDDLFLARSISEAAAELLQTIVHQRYKRHAAIVLTSNRLIDDWGKYLGDNTAATTIVDRLMHRSALLKFEGRSYRLNELATRITQPAQQNA